MPKLRVLVVDDSVVVRRILSETLAAEPDIEVVAAVGSASLALAKLGQASVDVVTLDVEMPDMNGLDLLLEIRQRFPTLPVIMFSSLTQRAAATTLDALARGATDYVTKPSGTGSREASLQQVKSELVPRIRGLVRRSEPLAVVAPAPALLRRPPSAAPPASRAIDALLVGSSTGGPNALAELFRGLPASLPVPVLVAQHMPPVFTKLLAERLSASCPIHFEEATDGALLEPGRGWVAPGDYHMRIVRRGTRLALALDQEARENSCRPAVDPLFRSAAELLGGRVLAVVLTGMGQDGLRGCELLRERGAQILAQDEQSSVVWGMPGFVAKAGLASAVLPLAQLAPEILRRIPRVAAASAARFMEPVHGR